MKLSVLITTYNLEQYVEQTLESVLSQNIDYEYEVLIGDDGSSDGTVDIVRRWMERYPNIIKLFVMDRNPDVKYNRIERASKNRINLIKNATGEYLIFLDGDDWYTDTDKLRKQVEYLDSHLDVIATAHDIQIYYSEDNHHRMLANMNKEFTVDGKFYWSSCMYLHSDTIMFRNIFRLENYVGEEANRIINDDVFSKNYDDNIIMFLLIGYGKIHYSPEVMACYRQLANSSWNSVSDIEKALVNACDYDLERQIASKYSCQTRLRHIRDIWTVVTRFSSITSDELLKYKKIAKECHYKTILRLLRGDKLSRFVAGLSAIPLLITELVLIIIKRIKYY